MATLQLIDITKSFGGLKAVDNITLDVLPGEIVGFLGPNGAGKTTTIKMIAGLLQPDHGEIRINGRSLQFEPLPCKQETGYIPDRPWLYEKLTGLEFLHFIASLYNKRQGTVLEEAARYLRLFDLMDWQHQLIESYSHGMRQKLLMTSVFMLNQPLLVIDEPMIGLDPKSARIIKELLKQRAAAGTGILLSTHSLEIAEELCHRIAIITAGRLRVVGDMEFLRQEAGSGHSGLEEIFLELTGAWELQHIIKALQDHQ